MAQINLKEIKCVPYQPVEVHQGYTDHSLHINVSNNKIKICDIEEKIKQKFIGGKGYDLWLMWHAVSGTTRWDDPENAICIASGPLGGGTWISRRRKEYCHHHFFPDRGPH